MYCTLHCLQRAAVCFKQDNEISGASARRRGEMETSYGFGPGVVRQPSPEAGKEVLATMTSQRAPGTDSRVLTCHCWKVKFGMSAGPQLSNRCIPADDLM